MRVLVACEESQRVCTAFRKRGHEAYSCDIQEPSGGHPEWHIQGDALELISLGNGKKAARKWGNKADGIEKAISVINAAPTIEASLCDFCQYDGCGNPCIVCPATAKEDKDG